MKIEKLRNNHKKEIIIGTILTVIIGGALTFRLTHSKYRVTQSIDLGSGVINYTVPDFKIMAMYLQKDESTCTEDSCYNELTGRMPSTGYVINTSKSYCTLDNVNHDNEAKLYTYEEKHVFENLKKSDKCYLYFDKIKITNVESLIANSHINNYSPTFNSIATTDEGIYQIADGMYGGTSYYWRGAVTNNYVKFAGYCWRIIRINGDKTIRLIYDGTTCHANGTNTTESIAVTNQEYNTNSTGRSECVGWTYTLGNQRGTSVTSNAKPQTENWYDIHIGNNAIYSTKVADGKFCNARHVGRGDKWTTSGSFNYEAFERIVVTKIPGLECYESDVYTLKVGLITADEAVFAGGKTYNNGNYYQNSSYYLYNGQSYWTMTPWSAEGEEYQPTLQIVNNHGGMIYTNTSAIHGLRPVINLKSDVTFSSGNGTQNSPYTAS